MLRESTLEIISVAIEQILSFIFYASAMAAVINGEARSVSEAAFTMLMRELIFYEVPAKERDSVKEPMGGGNGNERSVLR